MIALVVRDKKTAVVGTSIITEEQYITLGLYNLIMEVACQNVDLKQQLFDEAVDYSDDMFVQAAFDRFDMRIGKIEKFRSMGEETADLQSKKEAYIDDYCEEIFISQE